MREHLGRQHEHLYPIKKKKKKEHIYIFIYDITFSFCPFGVGSHFLCNENELGKLK